MLLAAKRAHMGYIVDPLQQHCAYGLDAPGLTTCSIAKQPSWHVLLPQYAYQAYA